MQKHSRWGRSSPLLLLLLPLTRSAASLTHTLSSLMDALFLSICPPIHQIYWFWGVNCCPFPVQSHTNERILFETDLLSPAPKPAHMHPPLHPCPPLARE